MKERVYAKYERYPVWDLVDEVEKEQVFEDMLEPGSRAMEDAVKQRKTREAA